MSLPFIENEYATCHIADGILYFAYKQDVIIDLEAAKKIVAERAQFQKGVVYPLYSDIRGVRHFEKSARDYFANVGTLGFKCVAVIVDSPANKLIADFYISVNKPITPTKIFQDEGEALAYLKQFRDAPSSN